MMIKSMSIDLDFCFTNSTWCLNAFTLMLEGNINQNMNICVQVTDWFEAL